MATTADVRQLSNAQDPEAQTFAGPEYINSAAGQAAVATSPPAKANAAPKPAKKSVITGLMDALNRAEADLVTNGMFEVANEYSVEFAPELLASSKVTKLGTTNKARVPMQQGRTAADKTNPDTNSIDSSVRSFSFAAGTPVVAAIDEILKSSSYITDQARVYVDEVTQEVKPQPPLGNLAWYKISVQTTPKIFDNKRLDYAYQVKFVISPYPISSMESEYFPPGTYRGVHKSYQYWFTGQNTQVLRFEQDYNSLYKLTFTNPNLLSETRQQTNNLLFTPRMYQAASAGSNSQGAEGRTNAIGASAADWLYSPTDVARAHLTIVGDPAWIQQGEASTGISAATFSFSPFLDDGTINFDAMEIAFDVQWNYGEDYDVNGTGLMSTSGTPSGQQPQTTKNQGIFTYKAVEVVSKFSRGKFEQDLKGVLTRIPIPEKNAATAATPDANRTTPPQDTTTARSPLISSTAAGQAADPTGSGNANDPESQVFVDSYNQVPTPPVAFRDTTDYGDPESLQFQTQAATQPAPATSDGVVVGAVNTAASVAAPNTAPQQQIATDD